MASYVGEGRVTDLDLFSAVTVTAPFDIGQIGRTVEDQHGNEFMLVIAGGTIPAAGACYLDQGDPGDALVGTSEAMTALATDAERKAQKWGAAMAAAAAGQAFWICTKKVSNEQADIDLLALTDIVAGAAVGTTAAAGTPGAIDESATGAYAFEGIDVVTAPGSGIAFDTVVWPNGFQLSTGTIVP